MPTAARCEYYGYLPKIVRKATLRPPAHVPASLTCLPTPLPTSSCALGAYPRGSIDEYAGLPCLYSLYKPLQYSLADLPPKPSSALRLVIISDTHERHREMIMPPGDVLVHCGDIQEGLNFLRDANSMLADFAAWFTDDALHPHPVKLIIAGNHDRALAAMRIEEVRRLFAPALYLHEDSVVIEPVGIRFYGSPRSISNSRWSPNTAFQGKRAWQPFMFPSVEEEGEARATGENTLPTLSSPLTARLEGHIPEGSIDILVVHQSPDIPRARHSVEEQPICTFAQQVAPRRVLLCGHLHGAHGMHRLPVPAAVQEGYAIRVRENQEARRGTAATEAIPFLPCINAAMMLGSFGRTILLSPSVIDLEL